LPNERVLDLLDLKGGETVVDYGAGTGTLTVVLAQRLKRCGGVVHAVDESPEMMVRLRRRLEGSGLTNVRTHLIHEDRVPLEPGAADRVLAVNLLHHVVGGTALLEMRRLLSAEGLLLVVDWRGDVDREVGPPKEETLSLKECRDALEATGFLVEPVWEHDFPYHLVMVARAR
jgi:cyclopropane fatty-acyl-phospholipid synthase-like methyltransferase